MSLFTPEEWAELRAFAQGRRELFARARAAGVQPKTGDRDWLHISDLTGDIARLVQQPKAAPTVPRTAMGKQLTSRWKDARVKNRARPSLPGLKPRPGETIDPTTGEITTRQAARKGYGAEPRSQ